MAWRTGAAHPWPVVHVRGIYLGKHACTTIIVGKDPGGLQVPTLFTCEIYYTASSVVLVMESTFLVKF